MAWRILNPKFPITKFPIPSSQIPSSEFKPLGALTRNLKPPRLSWKNLKLRRGLRSRAIPAGVFRMPKPSHVLRGAVFYVPALIGAPDAAHAATALRDLVLPWPWALPFLGLL